MKTSIVKVSDYQTPKSIVVELGGVICDILSGSPDDGKVTVDVENPQVGGDSEEETER